MEKKKKKNNWLFWILLAFFFCVFLLSAGMILRNVIWARQSARNFNQLEELIAQNETVEEEPLSAAETYGALKERNGDFIGWISIEGTRIDYPVVYRPEEEEYYLRRDFDGNYSYYGTPYLAENCEIGVSDNLILYGHHMNNGSMFSDLRKYTEQEFYESHKWIQFDTMEEFGTYEILSIFTTTADENGFAYHLFTKAETEAEFDAFLEQCKRRSYYETGVTAVYGDQLLTLSTCEYSRANGRLVVVAKKIQ